MGPGGYNGPKRPIFNRAAHLGKPRPPTEEQEQRTLALWLNLHPLILWCHVPNGGSRHPAEAAKLKAMGVKAGVPDLLIFTPPPKWSEAAREMPFLWYWIGDEALTGGASRYIEPVGIGIELKKQGATKSKVSTEQHGWKLGLGASGWYWFVARGAGEAIDELERLGYGTGARR